MYFIIEAAGFIFEAYFKNPHGWIRAEQVKGGSVR
jgi:hypothetical protein